MWEHPRMLKSVAVHRQKFLNVLRFVWDSLFAEEAASVGRNEHVVFNSDASKILEFFDFIEIEKFRVCSFSAPEVDEVWDEIDARFVGHDKALFKATGKTQRGGAKLAGRTDFIVIANVSLSCTSIPIMCPSP